MTLLNQSAGTLKIVSLLSIALLLSFTFYAALEPAVINAQGSDVANVQVNMTVDAEIAISNQDGNAINMGNLGVASNESVGGTDFEVVTNNSAGYELEVKAQDSPAMLAQSGQANNFPDYTEVSAGTPEPWDISSSGTAQDYAFGFSAYGGAADNGAKDWGAGTSCDDDVDSDEQGTAIPSGRNYVGFKGSSSQIKVGETSSAVGGEVTTICFAAAKQGDTADGQPESGAYQATVIATATNL